MPNISMMLWALAGAALLAVNIGGAALFVADKRRARRNGARRVPERVLLGLALAGAAPVMVWLTYRVRHKTRKEPFRTLLRVILGLQIVVALALAALWAGIL